jgi:hypothetical protein
MFWYISYIFLQFNPPNKSFCPFSCNFFYPLSFWISVIPFLFSYSISIFHVFFFNLVLILCIFFICLNSFIKVLLVFDSTFQSRFMLCYFCLVFSSFFFLLFFIELFFFSIKPSPMFVDPIHFFHYFFIQFRAPTVFFQGIIIIFFKNPINIIVFLLLSN